MSQLHIYLLTYQVYQTVFTAYSSRGMDSNEKWSITNIRNFVKQSNGTINNIIRLESFIDNDPGFGKGSPVSVPIPSTNVTSSLSTDVSSLSSGFHNILYQRNG